MPTESHQHPRKPKKKPRSRLDLERVSFQGPKVEGDSECVCVCVCEAERLRRFVQVASTKPGKAKPGNESRRVV